MERSTPLQRRFGPRIPVLFLLLFFFIGISSISYRSTAALEHEQECECFSSSSSSPDEPAGQQESSTTTIKNATTAAAADLPLKIFYLVLLHDERTANDAIHLLRSIRHPGNTILIHVDTKVAALAHDSALRREVVDCPCGSTITMESVHSVEWSKWSMNLPTLWGLQWAVSAAADWDVFVNLSGDTVPVYDVVTTARLLAQLPYNFVTSKACETGLFPTSVYELPKVWHKRRHYTHDETEPDPVFFVHDGGQVSITTHFGSQWIILQRDFCEWLMMELADSTSWVSQFRDYLMTSGKLMTDETFLPTVLMYAPERFSLPLVSARRSSDASNKHQQQQQPQYLIYANGTVSDITHVRYERMDEHFPTALSGIFPDQQRYQIPSSLLHRLDQPRVWGPYFLGVYDLGMIRQTGALFARKISALVDDNMVRILPVRRREDIPNIHWPVNEISIINKPDWSKERAMFTRVIRQSERGGGGPAAAAAADTTTENATAFTDDEEL